MRLATSAGVRLLSDEVLRVSGEDARAWLGGQVTNQTRLMSRGDAVYTLVLDVRGKILADAWVIERDDLVLVVPPGTRAALLEHFDAYIVMEDVELAALDEAVVTVQGPKAAEVVERAGRPSFPCDRLGLGGRDVVVPIADAERTRDELARAAEALGGGAVGEEGWELARLRVGRPRFSIDFGPANYPQEAGLERIAVSFLKGCYLGQEVVCTLQNRGQLSRRLVVLEGAELASGVELRLDGKVVGQVTSAVRDGAAGVARGLGYVKRAAASAGRVLGTERGEVVVKAIAGEDAPSAP